MKRRGTDFDDRRVFLGTRLGVSAWYFCGANRSTNEARGKNCVAATRE